MPQPPAKTPPPKPETRQMNVRLPVDLIDRLDARRKTKGMSRDKWVGNVIRAALDGRLGTTVQTARGQSTAPPPRNR